MFKLKRRVFNLKKWIRRLEIFQRVFVLLYYIRCPNALWSTECQRMALFKSKQRGFPFLCCLAGNVSVCLLPYRIHNPIRNSCCCRLTIKFLSLSLTTSMRARAYGLKLVVRALCAASQNLMPPSHSHILPIIVRWSCAPAALKRRPARDARACEVIIRFQRELPGATQEMARELLAACWSREDAPRQLCTPFAPQVSLSRHNVVPASISSRRLELPFSEIALRLSVQSAIVTACVQRSPLEWDSNFWLFPIMEFKSSRPKFLHTATLQICN